MLASGIFAAMCATCAYSASDASVVRMLGRDGTMEANGWTRLRNPPGDTFVVSRGELKMTFGSVHGSGAFYAREVELPAQGELSFDVRLDAKSTSRRERGLTVKLGNLVLAFSGDSCLRHQPGTAPAWKHVAYRRLRPDVWIPVRLAWDSPARKVKYYFGSGRVPSGVDVGIVIGKSSEDSAVRLKIGQSGVLPFRHVESIRNLAIRETGVSASAEKNLALVFRGLTDDEKIRPEWLAGYPEGRRVSFSLGFLGSTYLMKNRYAIDPCPDADLMDEASLIVLADIPLSYDVLPLDVQERMLASVKAGATLIVTDGLFALERCGNYESPVARALPVRLESPWNVVEGAERVEKRYGGGRIVVVKGSARKERKGSAE